MGESGTGGCFAGGSRVYLFELHWGKCLYGWGYGGGPLEKSAGS